jgi:hypothetical protein
MKDLAVWEMEEELPELQIRNKQIVLTKYFKFIFAISSLNANVCVTCKT